MTGRPRSTILDGKKQCSRCHDWKLLEEYYSNPATSSGKESHCKACAKEKIIKQHENIRTVMVRLRSSILSNGKSGKTKKRTRIVEESDFSLETLVELWDQQEGRCAVTGVPMTHIRGKQHSVLTNVSVDRIDSSKGYVPGNMRLVCRVVNVMKFTMTDRELLQWAALIVQGLTE